jgi:hypothetical protein
MGNKNGRNKISKSYFVHETDEIEKSTVEKLKLEWNNVTIKCYKKQNIFKIRENLANKNINFEDPKFKADSASICNVTDSTFTKGLKESIHCNEFTNLNDLILWQRIDVGINNTLNFILTRNNITF